ncbi:MAG: hypothetical protein ACK549_13255, partial [Cyanobacteriota bacterium]
MAGFSFGGTLLMDGHGQAHARGPNPKQAGPRVRAILPFGPWLIPLLPQLLPHLRLKPPSRRARWC